MQVKSEFFLNTYKYDSIHISLFFFSGIIDLKLIRQSDKEVGSSKFKTSCIMNSSTIGTSSSFSLAAAIIFLSIKLYSSRIVIFNVHKRSHQGCYFSLIRLFEFLSCSIHEILCISFIKNTISTSIL